LNNYFDLPHLVISFALIWSGFTGEIGAHLHTVL